VTKRRNFGDLIIIFILFTAILMVVQAPVTLIVWLVYEVIGFDEPFAFLIAQIITTVLVCLISRKYKMNKWFNAVSKNIILKLIAIILILIVLVTSVILNFEYQFLYVFLFAVIILLIGLALFPILMQLYYNTIGMISVHDLKNSLLSTGIAIQNETDIEVVKEHFRELSKAFGMDLSQLDEQKFEDELKHKELKMKQVEEFIRIKTASQDKKIEIISNVSYHSDYKTVEYKWFLKWLGTMLDNALEATNENPIYIHIGVTTYDLVLRIANEYIGDVEQDIQVIFERGYSTKGEGRGIGLHNLHKEVTEKGGEIILEEYYTEDHNCHYLQISILFDD